MDGVIVVNKPHGRTSHDMVCFMRRIAGVKKTGHTGTLDPDAEGVLPICIGKATKAADMITASDKAYRAELVLGMTTDTLDASGEILTDQPFSHIDEGMLKNSIKKFTGEIEQIPPMFSAIKKDGKKLYELARRGIEVEREKRRVRIDTLELLSFDRRSGRAEIYVECSKGTYIRSLIDDMGTDLGCGAYMNTLTRTRCGRFSIEESYTPAEIEAYAKRNGLYKILIPTEELFDYPKIMLDQNQSRLAVNGARIRFAGLADGCRYRVYDRDANFLSVSVCKNGVLVLEKAFWN